MNPSLCEYWGSELRSSGLRAYTQALYALHNLLSLYIFPKTMHHFTLVIIKDSAGILSLDTQYRLCLRCRLNCVPYRNISSTNSQYLCNRPYLEIIFVDNPVKIASLDWHVSNITLPLKKKLAMPWMWTSGLQNYETINFCCLTPLLAFC